MTENKTVARVNVRYKRVEAFPMRDVVLHGMEVQQRDEEIETGIRAMVRAYYDNYTDATELDLGFIRALQTIAANIYTDNFDVEAAIIEAERGINEAGGNRSDTDGLRYMVDTAGARGWITGGES